MDGCSIVRQAHSTDVDSVVAFPTLAGINPPTRKSSTEHVGGDFIRSVYLLAPSNSDKGHGSFVQCFYILEDACSFGQGSKPENIHHCTTSNIRGGWFCWWKLSCISDTTSHFQNGNIMSIGLSFVCMVLSCCLYFGKVKGNSIIVMVRSMCVDKDGSNGIVRIRCTVCCC